APWARRKSVMRRQAEACSSFHSPVSAGLIRPSGTTAVASAITSPAPPRANWPRWTRCQSLGTPLWAEYWHMGETHTRLGMRVSRSFSGSKRWLTLSTNHRWFFRIPGWAVTLLTAGCRAGSSLGGGAAPRSVSRKHHTILISSQTRILPPGRGRGSPTSGGTRRGSGPRHSSPPPRRHAQGESNAARRVHRTSAGAGSTRQSRISGNRDPGHFGDAGGADPR